MHRINIVGNAGSGKSTLASLLGAHLRIPVVHLDTLFWEPGWREPQPEVFRERVAHALVGESWICEGNYAARTFDLRLPNSNRFVWLDTPRVICAFRILFRPYLNTTRHHLPFGCQDGHLSNAFGLLRDVWTFDGSRRVRMQAEMARCEAMLPVEHLCGKDEIASFVAKLA